MNDQTRMTVRLPASAVQFLDNEADENFTSRNAQIVRAIRAAMKAKGAAEGATSPRQIHTNPSKGKDNEHAPE